MSAKIKNVFFDFNGTILDDLKLSYDLLVELCTQKNVPVVTMEQYLDVFTFPVKDYYKACGFDLEKIPFSEISEHFNSKYWERWKEETFIFPHCEEVLRKLKVEGYKIYILTACEKGLLESVLKYFKIFDLFDGLIANDNIHAHGKIEYGLEYIKENQINPTESILIGDTTYDKDVADALNMRCALFALGHNSEARLKEVADVLYSYRDIYNYIHEISD